MFRHLRIGQFAAVAALLESRRPKAQKNGDWIARQQDKVARSLTFMSEELGEKPFCMGTHISMADIAVGTALGYLCFRFPELAWQERHPNLDKLHAKLLQRPSFADTVPKD